MVLFGDSRLPARFWANVCVLATTGCWAWMGKKDGGGYAQFVVARRRFSAQRYAYARLIGPIPERLDLDHFKFDGPGSQCVGPICVLPGEHTRPATHRENLLRGNGLPSLYASRDRCGCGSEFTTYSNGARRCGPCHNATQRRYTARRREKRAAA